MQTKFYLFGHGGSGNKGCEAIARGTIDIIKQNFDDSAIVIASFHPDDDEKAGLSGAARLKSHRYPQYSLPWAAYAATSRLIGDKDRAFAILHRPAIVGAEQADISLSIGGDNYCYNKSAWLYSIDKRIKMRSKRIVLWGCSVEPKLLDDAMTEDLSRFDLITARESITYEALIDRGIAKNTKIYPDPAFLLQKENVQLPVGWREDKMIGINVSPLIMDYEKVPGLMLKSFAALVRHILTQTEYSVALIPHVTWSFNNDLVPLKALFKEFTDTDRVVLLDTYYNAPEMKGFISRCAAFIGARTHATIAAYSTCVPTLVIGYSVKARGIARDIFGDEEGLVLPIQLLQSEEQLISCFQAFMERKAELRVHLQQAMPDYIARAKSAGSELAWLLGQGQTIKVE